MHGGHQLGGRAQREPRRTQGLRRQDLDVDLARMDLSVTEEGDGPEDGGEEEEESCSGPVGAGARVLACDRWRGARLFSGLAALLRRLCRDGGFAFAFALPCAT